MSTKLRHYSNWLRQYIEFTKNSESPDIFHFWTGVSVIGGALRRRVWIEQHYFQWTPNFYIIFVAPPGIASKSTCINIGMRLLRQIEGIHFGPQSMTWQGLTMALEEAKDVILFEPDGKKAEPGEEQILQMSCLTIPVSELGTFLKTRDTELVSVLIDLWDGQLLPWRHRIKTGDKPITLIINPWMNIIGCTTPAWMKDNFSSQMIEGGLTSRIVFCYADKKRHLVAYPADIINSKEFEAQSRLLVDDLNQIAELIGQYELTSDAKIWGTAWYERHWKSRPVTMIGDRYLGYLSRKQTSIHKLGMVLAAAQRNDLLITHEDLSAADRIITGLEGDLQRVFATIGVTDSGKATAEVLAYVKAAGKIKYRELCRVLLSTVDRKQIDESITTLRSVGYLEMCSIDGEIAVSYIDQGAEEPRQSEGYKE